MEHKIKYIDSNFGIMDKIELCKNLNLKLNQVNSIIKKLNIEDRRKNSKWTENEINLMLDNIDNKSIYQVSKLVGRSEMSIRKKLKRLGISILDNRTVLTMQELAIILDVSKSTIKRWCDKKYIKTLPSPKQSYKFITWSSLFKFLKEHQNFYDASKIEVNILGKEPSWLINKRKEDMKKGHVRNKKQWNLKDDKALERLMKMNLSNKEIGDILGRTKNSISCRKSRIRKGVINYD